MPFVHSAFNLRIHRIALVLLALAALVGADRAWSAVTSVRAPRPQFSPNGDAVRDTLPVFWNLTTPAERVTIEVRRAATPEAQPAFRTYELIAPPAGADSLVWDGRDSSGIVMPDGFYNVRVAEWDVGPDTVLTKGSAGVELDNTPPPPPRFVPLFNDSVTTVPSFTFSGVVPGGGVSAVLLADGVFHHAISLALGDSTFSFTETLVPGTVAYSLQSQDRAGNQSAISFASFVTYLNAADVTEFRALPTRFSPNGDGVHDSLRITFRTDAQTTRLQVQIRKPLPGASTLADSLPYVRLYDAPADTGAHAFTWAGLDSTGAPAPGGGYFVYVSAESTTVGGAPAIGRPRTIRVELDLTAPSPPTLTEALPARTGHQLQRLVGFVTGGDSVRVYRNGTRILQGPGEFNLALNLLQGSNTIVLEGVDVAGNVGPASGPYVVVYSELAGFHAPERFRAADVFEVNLSTSPSAVRIELFSLDGRMLRVLESTSSNPNQELAWDLLDESGKTVGDGPVIARLTVTYTNGRVDQTKAAVVVAK